MKHRLIWDFHGPRAAGIATHHARHLGEFLDARGIAGDAGVERVSDAHHLAWCRVDAADGRTVHEALRSHRAVEEAD